jgi:hypothetical protein
MKFLLLTCSALAIILGAYSQANAQTTTDSSAVASSRTSSGAVSAGNTIIMPNNPSSISYNQSGHLYTTPSVPQAAYFAGTNPCLVGVGAGGSGGPIGLSFAFGHNDEGCTRRSDAAAWHALGMDDVAVARMLQDDDNAAAYKAAGRGVTPVAAVTPAPVAVIPTPVVVASGRPVPAWCANAVPSARLTQEYINYECGE